VPCPGGRSRPSRWRHDPRERWLAGLEPG
jgi:hypothetical protein